MYLTLQQGDLIFNELGRGQYLVLKDVSVRVNQEQEWLDFSFEENFVMVFSLPDYKIRPIYWLGQSMKIARKEPKLMKINTFLSDTKKYF